MREFCILLNADSIFLSIIEGQLLFFSLEIRIILEDDELRFSDLGTNAFLDSSR